jgi:hypothetical protein
MLAQRASTGESSLVARGIALARALAEAPDVPSTPLAAALEPAIAAATPAEAPIESNGQGDHQDDDLDHTGDPSTWPVWCDAFVLALGAVELEPEPTDADWAEVGELADQAAAQRFLDRSDRLTLPELVDRQADAYRAWGNAAGEMLARHMEELALRCRWVDATTPEDYDARHELVERDARESWWKQGFAAGRAAAGPAVELTAGYDA